MTIKIQLILGFIGLGLISLYGQQSVSVNGISFSSDLEVVEAQISRETISIIIDEIDKSNPKSQTDNCTDCPDGKSLILDVDFKRGFKFPIEATDSVFVRVSNLQENLGAYRHDSRQVEKAENSRNKSEEAGLKNNAEVLKVKGMEIAKLMQEGKITPQEAEQQLLKLTQSYNDDFERSSIANTEVEAYKERSHYGFHFYNNETLTETEPYSGYLYIIEFNKARFVAEYRGEVIERCVEKRAARSKEDEQKCKSKPSQYLPDGKVLSEGSAAVYIDINIKEFLNNR